MRKKTTNFPNRDARLLDAINIDGKNANADDKMGGDMDGFLLLK